MQCIGDRFASNVFCALRHDFYAAAEQSVSSSITAPGIPEPLESALQSVGGVFQTNR
jgi:hypothetical protein